VLNVIKRAFENPHWGTSDYPFMSKWGVNVYTTKRAEAPSRIPARLGNPYAQWSRSTSSFVSACSREKAKQPSRKRKRSSSSS
jgi:hypothetical protein